jgi:hypothetical protein
MAKTNADLRGRDPKLLCSAQKTHGRGPCQAYAIKGGTVCGAHGARAPQVRAKAQQRLAEMVMPALAELNKIIHDKRTSPETKVRAIEAVMDRVPGLSKRSATEAEVKVSGQVEHMHGSPEFLAMVAAAKKRLEQDVANNVHRVSASRKALEDAIDADVIESDQEWTTIVEGESPSITEETQSVEEITLMNVDDPDENVEHLFTRPRRGK